MLKKRLNRFSIAVMLLLMLVFGTSTAQAYVTCDRDHCQGTTKFVPCSGSGTASVGATSATYTYIGNWSSQDAIVARDSGQGGGWCVEQEWHFDQVMNSGSITSWWSTCVNADLDMDSGEKHIDIHTEKWGEEAVADGYIQNSVTFTRTLYYYPNGLPNLIGTAYVVGEHSDPLGWTCGSTNYCIRGTVYKADGTLHPYSNTWLVNGSWTDGDRCPNRDSYSS